MADKLFNLTGLQLGISPFLMQPGQFTRLINIDSNPIGVKQKRAGYGTIFNSFGAKIDSLFSWLQDDGTTLNVYIASGGSLFYSAQGTATPTICGNGTLTAGAAIGYTVLNNTLIIGDGTAATRHSTDGTSFTNTPLAPVASKFLTYQGRVYAMGTSSYLFYSVVANGTNWNTAGTSDSSSIYIPGAGKLLDMFKVSDRVITAKNSGVMHRWDGYNLYDLSTNLGPTSPSSSVKIEDFAFYLNRLGYYGFNGDIPKIISNPIRPQIYNDSGSAIVGTVFNNAPAGVYKYSYLAAVGSVTDDFTQETIPNCLQIYNYQLDEWSNYNFGTLPTSFHTYTDATSVQQTIFGDNSGLVYQYGGTYLSDNGLPVEAIMECVWTGGLPELEKEFNYIWLFFNPGCQARVQVAVGNYFTKGKKDWKDLGSVSNGVAEFHFSKERGRLLFIKISEYSQDTRFSYYGCSIDYDPIVRK